MSNVNDEIKIIKYLLNYNYNTIIQYTNYLKNHEYASLKEKIFLINTISVLAESNKHYNSIEQNIMIKQVKELRVQIDGLAQLVKELKPLNPIAIDLKYIPEGWDLERTINFFKEEGYFIADSFRKDKADNAIVQLPNQYKEIENSYNSLLLAKAWLGKVLAELGTENPYGSGYKKVEDIVPTQDVARQDVPTPFDGSKNHIEKVDWLRTEIEKLIQEISKWNTHTQTPTREFAIARTNCYNHLCEAKFWLGFELQRIKESN